MKIGELLSRLDGVTECAGGWMARCPAHGDSNPSLSVSERDGRILVHCHAGCTAQAVVEALGLGMRDLFEDAGDAPAAPVAEGPGDGGVAERAALGTVKGDGKKKSGGHGKWVCDYLYQDETGKVAYRVSRYARPDGSKSFTISRPDPASKFGWSYGLTAAGVARLPYRLPRVVEASRKGRQIAVLEGEKDVESFEKSLGMVATCNPGGAMKWGHGWPEGWVKWFRGSGGILIVADNDPKEKPDQNTGKMVPHWRGQRHAWDVRRKLIAAGYGGPIRLITMPPVGGKPVKDFTEWAEARRAAGLAVDRDAMSEAIREAGEWPEEWEFGGLSDHSSAITTRSGGESGEARPSPLQGSESVAPTEGDASSGAPGKMGRFGAPVSRAPGDDSRRYVVDFEIGSKMVKLSLKYGWTPGIIFAYSVAEVSRVSPNGELPKGVAVRLKAWSAALWLIMRGSFFWHSDYRDFDTCMFLDRDEANCRLMRVMSDEFFAFIGKNARLEDVEPKRGDLAKILGLVKQIAVSDEYSRGVVPSNSWDRRGDAVYISSGDTEMCRIRGGKCEMVQNGTDGVVFLRGKTLAPWRLVDGDGVDPFATARIFTGASFADAHGAMNVRLWVLNLFAAHATKPPLLITGGAGSGKTRMAKGIKEILGIRQDGALDLSVQQIEDGDKGLDAFWTTVNDGKLEVFDNFDTKVKWASDTLQNAATDGQTKRRTLYTTEGVSILKANASLILTSNNPIFSTEGNGGLADRLITIPLTLNRSASVDKELSVEIAKNRDNYMTWMARTVAKALMDSEPVDASVNRRHPDYGEFSVRIGRAMGCVADVIEAMGSAEADKALLPLQNDVITRELLAVLKGHGWKWSGTSGEMSGLIVANLGEDGDAKTSQIYSSRRVGKALSKYERQLSVLFRMDKPRIVTGKTMYSFDGLTTLGASVVGLVDLEGRFAKSAAGAGACGFTGIGTLNPPNPPVRAGACDVSPSLVEEEIKERDMESYGDLEF